MKLSNPEAFNIRQEGKDTIITLKDKDENKEANTSTEDITDR
jgi:hypothetical protein